MQPGAPRGFLFLSQRRTGCRRIAEGHSGAGDGIEPGLQLHWYAEVVHWHAIAVAAAQYLAQHGRPRHPTELAGHSCVGYSQHVNNRPWTFQVDGRQESFYLPFRLQANNGDALAAAAAQGLGITILPDFIAADYLRQASWKPCWKRSSHRRWASTRCCPATATCPTAYG